MHVVAVKRDALNALEDMQSDEGYYTNVVLKTEECVVVKYNDLYNGGDDPKAFKITVNVQRL